ncbi:MAG: hypothetical protein BGO43_13560 [Gammaproteobacteria bacterium 39-13]|nr:type-F conjugative transfer system secretin TraK [Gammaproteobacteria bacterium]OJV94773.1 MAG: hypothetical protein BGO43_13560 [Gammaproteobacteria bacterium 39-13]
MRKKCSLLIFLFSTSTFAIQNKSVIDGETIHANISQNELTRIFIQSDRIREVKSANSNFVLEKDEENGQIFLMPNSGQESTVNLFLTTELGRTISLSLKPKLSTAETLKLEFISSDSATPSAPPFSYEASIFQLMKAMKARKSLEGYIAQPKSDVNVIENGLEKSEVMAYLGKFKGKILSVKNQTDTLIKVDEEEFKEQGIKAIAIAKRILMPQERTEAYLILGA